MTAAVGYARLLPRHSPVTTFLARFIFSALTGWSGYEDLSEALVAKTVDRILKRLRSEREPPSDLPHVQFMKEEPQKLAEETILWLIHQLRKIVEIGMNKVAAKSTGKSEKIRWVNTIARVAEVLKGVVEDVELSQIYADLEALKEDNKQKPFHTP